MIKFKNPCVFEPRPVSDVINHIMQHTDYTTAVMVRILGYLATHLADDQKIELVKLLDNTVNHFGSKYEWTPVEVSEEEQ